MRLQELQLEGNIADIGSIGSLKREAWIAQFRDSLSLHLGISAYRIFVLYVRAGSVVALEMRKSVEMAVAVFGVLKAGGAFLPLDPVWPTERKQFILQDARCDHHPRGAQSPE